MNETTKSMVANNDLHEAEQHIAKEFEPTGTESGSSTSDYPLKSQYNSLLQQRAQIRAKISNLDKELDAVNDLIEIHKTHIRKWPNYTKEAGINYEITREKPDEQ